ncbi:hypothetical protein NEMIN01_2237 [Nematocida minor]|uniref:uncharacterized protein n=1 Tax=Nematocida minor TaxID=1912983 RepID=UPI00221FB30B|nr:uncharacterized protein NEMIN01_2237 [Nematocida minor]KAI5192821.1 hypothetical protein NEMIN01_2237 [Nematocida minor]
MLIGLLIVLCIVASKVAIFYFYMRRSRHESASPSPRKPLNVLVLNRYGCIPKEYISKLSSKYNVKFTVLEGPVKSEEYEENHRDFMSQMNPKDGKVEYSEITQFIEENRTIFPDIVILCSNTTVFKTSLPYLLYSAETLHYRQEFSESVLKKALAHYDSCEIRDGK